jgi:cysteine-rich repeat protein
MVLAMCLVACWETPEQPPPRQVVCGDGILEAAEQCDNGAANSDTNPGACRTTCMLADCGDRVVDPNEACDDGNRTAGDGCAATCRKIERCGDGILDPGGEQCDEGTNNSDTTANRCRTNCTPARCGDSVKDTGEECDDGNVENGDTCDSNCTVPRCGNRIIGSFEECDDGNAFNTDACLPNCKRNQCTGGVSPDGNRCFVIGTYPVPDSELRAVEIADLDGNGWPDIAVVDRDDDTVKLFWNNNGTGFTQAEVDVESSFLSATDPVDLAIGDINGDGKLDLATANEGKDEVCLLENTGNRTFKRHFITALGQPTDVALANIDGSPGLEVLVGLDNVPEFRVIRLSGFSAIGLHQTISTSSATSLGAGDLDGDGDADVAWTTGSAAFAANEGGSLVKKSLANSQSSSSAVKIWELDGTPPAELVSGVYGTFFTDEHLRIFSNPGGPGASYRDVPVQKWPEYLAHSSSMVAYADSDGIFGVLRNEQGTLLDESLFTYDGDASGLAAGDLDKDGSPDVVIISQDKKAVLLFRGKSN